MTLDASNSSAALLVKWELHRGGGAGGFDRKGRYWLIRRRQGLWTAYYSVPGGVAHEVTACRSRSAEGARGKVDDVLRREEARSDGA